MKKRDENRPTDPELRRRWVRLAYRYLWRIEDAEDVVQSAMLRATQRADQLRNVEKWDAWVSQIVVRECLQFRRDAARRRTRESEAVDRATTAASSGEAVDVPGSDTTTAQLARWALQRLPEKQRMAVVLRRLEGMSYQRVAELMGLEEATARVHVFKGLEAMRQMMVERNDGTLSAKTGAGDEGFEQ
jgi:RNA polymerase sigma-70 factor (ECF subfamily)